MTPSPDPFDLIVRYAQDFFDLVDQYAATTPHNPALLADAYNRLNRARERYGKMEDALSEHQRVALDKVFQQDVFITRLLSGARQLGEHMDKDGASVEIRTPHNQPMHFEVSALPFYGGAVVHLPDVQGVMRSIDHLAFLREAERRVRDALRRATEDRAPS
jgi:hypothetical protein